MSVSNDSASTGDDVPLSSTFLEFCAKVRKDDPSILPPVGYPFKIRRLLSAKEHMELADALLENTNVTFLDLETTKYTKSSAEGMAKYVRTSKRLQRIHWNRNVILNDRALQQHEEMLCCVLPAIQESTSLNELQIDLPLIGGPSNLALGNMLTHTQSLRSLSLIYPSGPLEDMAVAAISSGLKKNIILRELTLRVSHGAVYPILTSLRDHPHLRRLCMRGCEMDLTGLETVLLSDTSEISELDIDRSDRGLSIMGLTPVLHALGRHSKLTKLGLHHCPLGRDEGARLLRLALCNMSSLQSLVLRGSILGSTGLAELAPALYHNT
jgi:hypothetical protein